MSNWKIYIAAHKCLYERMYSGDSLFGNNHYTIMNVGPEYCIDNNQGLDIWDPKEKTDYLAMGKWWAETEGIYNLWKSGEWKSLDYIGFIHYDHELKLRFPQKGERNITNITERINSIIEKNYGKPIHISLEANDSVIMYRQRVLLDLANPNVKSGEGINCYDAILKDYNDYFGTKYRRWQLLLKRRQTVCSSFLIDTGHFDEMMRWFSSIIESRKLDQLDVEHKYRIQGGLAERYYSVYLAFAYAHMYEMTLIHHWNEGLKEE